MVSQDYRPPAPTPGRSFPCHPRPAPIPAIPTPSAAIPGPRPLLPSLPSHPRLHLLLPSPHRLLPGPSHSLPCHPTPLLSQPSPQPWLLSLALPLPPPPAPTMHACSRKRKHNAAGVGGGVGGGDSPMNRWITFVNMKKTRFLFPRDAAAAVREGNYVPANEAERWTWGGICRGVCHDGAVPGSVHLVRPGGVRRTLNKTGFADGNIRRILSSLGTGLQPAGIPTARIRANTMLCLYRNFGGRKVGGHSTAVLICNPTAPPRGPTPNP